MSVRVRLFWGITLAVLAALLTYQYANNLKRQVTVLVASRDIPARTVITADMLRAATMHADDQTNLLPGAFGEIAQAVGNVAVQEIPAGEVVRNHPRWVTRDQQTVQAAAKQRLSYFLPKEARAITVVVDSSGTVAGRVKEGDLVDILFTSQNDSTGGVYTALLLQQVRVLGIDGGGSGYQVTLLVTPQQALDLTLAKRRGTIDLALTPTVAELVDLPPSSPLKFLKLGQKP